jgi:hypothetical protein
MRNQSSRLLLKDKKPSEKIIKTLDFLIALHAEMRKLLKEIPLSDILILGMGEGWSMRSDPCNISHLTRIDAMISSVRILRALSSSSPSLGASS